MTAKAKLFSAGAVALGVFLVLWATVLGPGGQPLDPPPSEGTAPIVAAEVGEEKKTDAPRTEEPEAKRTADPGPEKPTHGSLEVRVVHHDDTPAPDVLIVLYRQGVDDEFLTPEKMTGAEGTVLFEELAPGRVFPHPRQASNTFGNATVEAGKRTVETIKLPRGCDVTGVVVDSAGKPVPGADVLVAPWAQHLAWPVAETDARGRFSLRGIGTHFHVGARARGFAPSVLQQLQGSEGGEIELRVELPGAGGAAVVSVEGPDGKPVRGALVEIGSRKSVNRSIRLASGASARRPHPQRRRTEATGRATFAGLEPGTHPVGVRAVGAAFWSGEITIHAKGSEEVLARLVEPVTIEGTVTTYAGAPAPKVDIQVGSWDSFENFRTTTAADGSYRLTDLAPGEFTVTARDGNRANVKKQLTAVAGQTLRWDTKLPAGMKILGRVVDERGKGMKGKRIEATLMRFNKGDTWFGHAVTDKEGRFVLKGCLPGRGVRIDVRGGMFPRARVEDVKPGGAEVLIRLTDASKPSVHLTGKVVLPDGKPAQNVQVSCFRGTGGSSGVHTTGVDGTFKLGPYSPGEFTLSLRPNGYPRVRKKTGELVPDETWNGGTIELVQGGHCVVTVRDASGNTVPELDAELRDDKGAWVDRLKIENGKGRSVPIAPGTYLLCVFGKDVAHQAVGFVVSPGVDVPIPVTVARGIPVKVRIAFPEGVKANNTLLRVTDANGRAVAYTGAWRQGRAAAKTLRLTPGRYRVRATVGSALSAEREVTVNDGGEATVELTLGR